VPEGTAPAPFPRPAASARESRRDLVPGLVVGVVVLLLLTAPISGPEGTPTIAPLLVHVVLFGVLAAALLRPWQRSGWPGPVGGPMLAATAYGAAIELVQVALPYRTGDPLDVLADAVGAGLGAWGAHQLRRTR
jgi:membrane associated rhomboid family serine protease